MDYLFYQVAAINGFDADGHYLRAGLILNACSQYAIASSPDCLATFGNSGSGQRPRGERDHVARATPTRAARARCASSTPTSTARRCRPAARDTRSVGKDGRARPTDGATRRPAPPPRRHGARGATPPRRPTPRPRPASGIDPASALLDYLLGGDG